MGTAPSHVLFSEISSDTLILGGMHRDPGGPQLEWVLEKSRTRGGLDSVASRIETLSPKIQVDLHFCFYLLFETLGKLLFYNGINKIN